MRSAERQFEQLDFPEEDPSGASRPDPHLDPHPDPRAALKQQVSERLAAHRSRRSQPSAANLLSIPMVESKPVRARTNRIANAVAERYAQTQSYRDFLAAEAARAIEAAHAAAEIAARNAQAVTIAQQQLLAELEHWSEPALETSFSGTPQAEPRPENVVFGEQSSTPERPTTAPRAQIQHPIEGLTVRLYEDVALRSALTANGVRLNQARSQNQARSENRARSENQARSENRARSENQARSESVPTDEEENFLLDDEIAFRQTPVFAEPAGPTVTIPANLLEFPRQLVAPRKARPRLAEGPLREEADTAPATAQLRIFEVEADQISTAPDVGVESAVPEWSSIHLDASPVIAPEAQEELQALLPLETASLNLRLMAAAVDGCILGFTLLIAAAAFAYATDVFPALPIAAMAAAATLLVLFLLYNLLFFTFSDATPGMRYARIGLCTFSDENPTPAQMRRRIWATLLSACPLGIGFLWALLDDDRLGWHDRISRMYQRGY